MYGYPFTIPIFLLLYSGGQLFHHMAILIFTFANPVQCTHICFSKMQCSFFLSSFSSPVFISPFHTSYPLNSEQKGIPSVHGEMENIVVVGLKEKKGGNVLEKQVVQLDAWMKTYFVAFQFVKYLITIIPILISPIFC